VRQFLNWEEAYKAGPAVCGGKGYNLARLHRYGFPVPRGGVLPPETPLSVLRSGLEQAGLTDAVVAVRSSATGEDSELASFAGMHRSFLNVAGQDAIERAAEACIDSLNEPAAVAYRLQMAFDAQHVRCAVVVCEMVKAECAGVLFTCDPLSGRRDRYIINASVGLGDRVVSGAINPDRAVWQRDGRAMKRVEGPAALSALPVDMEEQLVHLAQRLHWALGEGQNPQDIEWAWDSNQLWLLQARPVTKLPRPVWPEVASMPVFWSTANIKDAVPGVVCELSWSGLSSIVGEIAYAAQKTAGYQMPPGMEVVRRIEGRGFFDLTMMQWAFYDAFGLMPGEIVKVIGGHQPEIEVPADPLKDATGRRRRRAGLRLFRHIWNFAAASKKVIHAQLGMARRYASIDWTIKSRTELSTAFGELLEAQHDFLAIAGLANSCSGPWDRALRYLLKDDTLVARLQTGAGGVASAEQGYRLFDVAMGRATLEDFLSEFGHRCVYESDLINPRWSEDSSWVQQQIEAIKLEPGFRDPRFTAAEVRQGAEQELRKKAGWKAPLILWMVRRLRAANAARENAKSSLVALALPVRLIALEVGRRLVAESKLGHANQVFDFTFDDLIFWLSGEWDGSGAAALTHDRIERRKYWQKTEVPDLITERATGSFVQSSEKRPPVADGAWLGIAISPGTASGPARIIRTPVDAARLREGDILVAPSTDPGWTPLFLRSKAVVMETGGFLSHGAIVAREYGLPAVANIPSILDQLESGAWIEVNGSSGFVRRVMAPSTKELPE
jgi:rifampicin phosphotransferase